MKAVMAKKKTARKFDDGYRLASRSLPEIREALESEVDRLRWEKKLRVGGEPLSLTTLCNGLLVWYLGLSDPERNKAGIGGCDKLTELLNSEVPVDLVPESNRRKRYEDHAGPVVQTSIADMGKLGSKTDGSLHSNHKVAKASGKPKG